MKPNESLINNLPTLGKLCIDKWLKQALSTDALDITKATESVNLLYSSAKLHQPVVCFVRSPWEASKLFKGFCINNPEIVEDNKSIWQHIEYRPILSCERTLNQGVLGTSYGLCRSHIMESVQRITTPIMNCICDPENLDADCFFSRGSMDSWLSVYDYLTNYKLNLPSLNGLMACAKNCGWLLPMSNCVLVCQRPLTIKTNTHGRLHCIDGPAIAYADGFCVYAYQGTRIPAELVLNRQAITLDAIDNERNAELRRCLIGLYPGGIQAYIANSKATIVHRDDYGTLYKKELESGAVVMAVLVICPSTGREYMMCVNSYLVRQLGGTARAAVASTWRYMNNQSKCIFRKDTDYSPLIET